MASLNDFIRPDAEKLRQEHEETSAVEQTKPEGPSNIDMFKAHYSNAYMHTIGVGGMAIGVDYMLNGMDATTYTEQQLSELYPDVPKEVFKNGARAYQAEFLVDKYKKEEEAKQIQEFIQGVANPNASVLTTIEREALPFTASLMGGLADVANIPIAFAGGAILGSSTKALAPLMNKLSPSAYKTMVGAIGSSRFLSNVVPEVVSNLVTDVAVSYPTQNYLMSGYTKDEATLADVIKQSLGSALLFGVGKGIFKGKNVEFGKYSEHVIQESVNRTVKTNADLASIKAGSDVHGEIILKTAIADAVLNSSQSKTSIRERLAEKAFKGTSNDIPDQGLFALVEKGSGKTEYLGNRYGDNFVFIDSPGAIDGMAKIYSADEPRAFDVYNINPDNYRLADIDSESLKSHPEIVDVLDEQFGSSILHLLRDESTVGEALSIVGKSKFSQEHSGDDVIALYSKINDVLKDKGFDGIVHTNELGDAHKVVEIFPDRLNPDDLQMSKEITGNTKETEVMSSPRQRDSDVVLQDGQIIKATEEVPYDPFYDEDFDFNQQYNKVNKEFVPTEDILMYDETKVIEPATELVTDDVPELKAELDAENSKFKADSPEKQDEIVKAMEYCLRKNK